MSEWEFLIAFCLVGALWFCGSGAAHSPSPPMSLVKFGIALATGYMARGAPPPVGAIGLAVAVFTVGYLVTRGERKRIP